LKYHLHHHLRRLLQQHHRLLQRQPVKFVKLILRLLQLYQIKVRQMIQIKHKNKQIFDINLLNYLPMVLRLQRIRMEVNHQHPREQMKIHLVLHQQNSIHINNQKMLYHNQHHQLHHLDQVQYLDQNLRHQDHRLVHQQQLVKNQHQVNHLNSHNQVIQVFVHEL
jgi:hypothetical protein